MTSLFSTSYIETQDRINKSAHARPTDKTHNQIPQKNFANVLGDVQNRTQNTKTSNDLALENQNPKSGPSDVISNLHLLEHEQFKTSIPPLIKSASVIESAGSKGDINASFHVNPLNLSVKDNAIGKITKSVPQTPTILSAQRIFATWPPHKAYASHANIRDIITVAGQHHGIDPELSIAVAKAESSLRPGAISKDGHETKGLFQLLDQTAKEMLVRYRLKDKYDPFDPKLNAYLGVGYLRKLHDIFSRETYLAAGLKTIPAKSAADLEKLAIAAFNAGEGNVALAQAKAQSLGKDPTNFEDVEPHLPQGTRAYVARVANIRASLKANSEIRDIA